jgi:type VI secretion system protein ImpJ
VSWDSKVAWSEGMFLRAQHFQQHDRYVERLVRGRVGGVRPYAWGLSEIRIDRDLLKTGKLAILSCRGILDDGTPFDVPGDENPPTPLELAETARNSTVYLALPVRQPGTTEFAAPDAHEAITRYVTSEYEAIDANVGADNVSRLRVGKLHLRLMLEAEDRAGYSCLAIARIVEVRADRQVVLDQQFIPPCLNCEASPVLTGFLAELQGLFHHRGSAIAERVADTSGRGGVGEVADFLLLQAVNRYEPLLAHYVGLAELHPESFYALAVEMAGELATFTSKTRRPPDFPVYRHDDLTRTFAAVIAELRQSLSAVLEQTAIPIPLQLRKFGIRVAALADRTLLSNAAFVLTVRADMPAEALRRNFPNQVKIGPVEQIREIVGAAVSGVPVRALPVAPRQIPYHAGASYFELDKATPLWKQLSTSGGFAIYLPDGFPQVEMEFWAIRG